MNDLTKQLIKDLNSTSAVKESRMLQLVVSGLQTAVDHSTQDIFEKTLSDVKNLAKTVKDKEVDSLVSKYEKEAETPEKKVKKISKKANLKGKLEKIKESGTYADPIFKITVSKLESAVDRGNEAVLVESVIKTLSNFKFDPIIESVVTELNAYVLENRSEIEVFKTIASLKSIPNQFYLTLCEKLENLIIEGTITSDYIRMAMAESSELPAIKNLLNSLSLIESSNTGNFSLGTGYGSTKINPVVGLYSRRGNEIKVLIENFVLSIDEDTEVPNLIAAKDLSKTDPEFAKVVEAFVALGFTSTDRGIVAKGKGNTIAFVINERGDLQLELNGKAVDNLGDSKIYEALIIESLEFKNNLSTVIKNAGNIAQFEFVQRLVNESAKSFAINTSNAGIFVLDQQGLRSYDELGFHQYVAETFKYDISELYSIQLTEKQEKIKKSKKRKDEIESDIKKLEESIDQLNTVIEEADETAQEQLEELKRAIQGNIVNLKNEFLTIEESLQDVKKKV